MPEDAKIHVGNLAFDTRETDLRDEFGRFGRIEHVQIIKDRETGRPKGYGFVTFENYEDMKDAISDMHQREFLGRPIKCERAKPRRSEGGGGGFRGSRDSFDRRDDRRGGRRDDFRRNDFHRDDHRGDFRRDDRDFRRDDRGYGRDDRDFRGRRGGSRDRDRRF